MSKAILTLVQTHNCWSKLCQSSKSEQRDYYIKSNLWVPSKPFSTSLRPQISGMNEDQEKCIAFITNVTWPRQLFGEIFINVTLLTPIINETHSRDSQSDMGSLDYLVAFITNVTLLMPIIRSSWLQLYSRQLLVRSNEIHSRDSHSLVQSDMGSLDHLVQQ